MNTDNTQDGAEPSPASAGSHGAVWITPAVAMPQPNIDALLWCDQGIVIGYHNGCGDWRLAPIEEEPRPWRLSATNVTHWAELPEPPPLGCRQPSAVLTTQQRYAIASRGSHANILDEAREWLARSRAAKPLPSERIIASLLVHATLSDEERAAIAWCVGMAETTATECDEELAALRGLLARFE